MKKDRREKKKHQSTHTQKTLKTLMHIKANEKFFISVNRAIHAYSRYVTILISKKTVTRKQTNHLNCSSVATLPLALASVTEVGTGLSN